MKYARDNLLPRTPISHRFVLWQASLMAAPGGGAGLWGTVVQPQRLRRPVRHRVAACRLPSSGV
jgi:hypothetical protein